MMLIGWIGDRMKVSVNLSLKVVSILPNWRGNINF